jgi:DNA-binding CsgD family transcriptional regulator
MRELHEVGPLGSAKKRHLLRALLGLTHSKGAILLEGRVTTGEKRLSPTSVAYEGWEKPAESRVLADYYQTQHPLDPLDPAAATALAAGPQLQTYMRRELIGDAEWYDSDHVRKVRKAIGVDDVLLAINRLTNEHHYALLSLHRTPQAGRFTQRERTMLELVHSQTAWLYSMQEDNGKTSLAPRLRNTLQHLLAGMSEKEIAIRSGLTRNTVHEYVKRIYAYFGVSSRAELMAKVLGGGRQQDSGK